MAGRGATQPVPLWPVPLQPSDLWTPMSSALPTMSRWPAGQHSKGEAELSGSPGPWICIDPFYIKIFPTMATGPRSHWARWGWRGQCCARSVVPFSGEPYGQGFAEGAQDAASGDCDSLFPVPSHLRDLMISVIPRLGENRFAAVTIRLVS